MKLTTQIIRDTKMFKSSISITSIRDMIDHLAIIGRYVVYDTELEKIKAYWITLFVNVDYPYSVKISSLEDLDVLANQYDPYLVDIVSSRIHSIILENVDNSLSLTKGS